MRAGVRAEHLRLTDASGGPTGQIRKREFLGDKILYDVEMQSHRVSVLTEPTDHRDSNSAVGVLADSGSILLFDPETGQRLS